MKDISIPLSKEQIKHLILTGKNGSGKTSVVEALAGYINNSFTDQYFQTKEELFHNAEKQREIAIQSRENEIELLRLENKLCKKRKILIEAEKVWMCNLMKKQGIFLC